ncbi:subtilisin-like protease SBT3.13 isoform X2 [Brassica rapa]|uniref:subtilisin-like protease SBT3.13 isoform X2 n=1 Tax=Brassica campestris TaxID=3711 RepID=UPI00142E494E|nr:subtilisin-like protease SBT3.13 isoform X2 [Brassica rapa]XP_033142736.1 subtilisin-like protease SBT3.13 isoform X2 [Brassica rapa]
MENSLPSYKLVLLLAFSLFLLVNTELGFLSPARAIDNNTKVYIVYLGERENDDPELVTASHHQMLESFLDSKEDAHKSMIYSYPHGFSGFAALLTSSQANKISDHPEVIHVIPNRILKLQTTRTWDLLELSQIPTSFSSSTTSVKGLLHDTNMGSEAIIGVIDTGIWPESKVFNDQGLGPIPKRWRGKCEPGEKFNATIHCNKKLIGAKYYVNGLLAEMGETFKTTTVREFKSNRDALGHGTHTATIAGGSLVPNVSFYGLARGTVRGGAPRARIASYKVCWNTMQKDGTGPGGSCSTADMLKAFDDAIHDGVDVLSVSISGDLPEDTEVDKPDFVGAFHAVSKGIPVVAAASNEGPKAQTVANAAPWLLTVAATTLDRSFPTKITLGNKQTLFGESLFTGPEISTGLAYWDSESDDNGDVKGKIVLVFDTTSTYPVETKGVAGVIYAQHPDDIVDRCHAFPCIYTDYDLGTDILQYIRTTRSFILKQINYVHKVLTKKEKTIFIKLSFLMIPTSNHGSPTARISAATTLTGLPATTKVAEFSSRGPNSVSPAILKPDIAAPGVSILAALSPFDPNGHDGFGLASGTSMSTPVVSGIIALLKSLHPDWSPAAFRSALVTTAWRTSPSGEPIFAEGSNKKLADPFDYGGGLVNPQRAAHPGLVYDMGIEDYINYMCSKGYNDSSISRVIGKKTKCPTPKPSILDMNLPSITIPNIEKEVTLTRSVTNVGPIKSIYKAVIESPLGITLTVNPTTLVFSSEDKKVLSFTVKAKTSHKVNTGYFFGSLTWTDGVHDVKIPVSVQTRIMIKS